MSNYVELADEILSGYWAVNKTAKEIFFSIPRANLFRMRAAYELALLSGDVPESDHLGRNWHINRIKLFVNRITQTLNGVWL